MEVRWDPLLGKKCKCCLNDDGPLKDLWAEYFIEGDREIYGEMLSECFALSWQQPIEYDDLICTSCINRLRSAYDFRKEVLTSEQIMQQLANCLGNTKQGVMDEDKADSDEEWEPTGSAGSLEDLDQDELDEEEPQNDDVEYLEIDFLDDESDNIPETSKGGAKRKKQDKGAYKKYSNNQLDQCLDMVRTRNMTKSTAAAVYNVPARTIASKLKQKPKSIEIRIKCDTPKSESGFCDFDIATESLPKVDPNIDYRLIPDHKKNYQNTRAILLSSNATPIKSSSGREYACCFCPSKFEEAADLKDHTINDHDTATKAAFMKGTSIDIFCVRLDITDLQCLCSRKLATLEQLKDHLKTKHKIMIHTDIKNQIVPFKFDDKVLLCAICRLEFSYFRFLNQHMSEHYRNFECPECHNGFILKSSLQTHRNIHKTGTFKCRLCDKVFSSHTNRRQHERVTHVFKSKPYSCDICYERFSDYTAKSRHRTEAHGAKPQVFACQACDSTFVRQRTLTEHVRGYHMMVKPFRCSLCPWSFRRKKDLAQHMLRHTKVRKFQCHLCPKAFLRKFTLTEHLRIHNGDKRFECHHCGERFLHKMTFNRHLEKQHMDEQ